MNGLKSRMRIIVTLTLVATWALLATAQEIVLRLDPKQSRAEFTLGATMHTVEGSFTLKRGEIHLDPSSGKVSGEIVFDAGSGQTGNDRRDHKMHKEVLESALFPEITFRPAKVEGAVAPQGSSDIQVTGTFAIHGTEQQLTAPVHIDASADKWTGEAHFAIPYVKWGMKNPSNVLLHVASSVDVSLHLSATVSSPR